MEILHNIQSVSRNNLCCCVKMEQKRRRICSLLTLCGIRYIVKKMFSKQTLPKGRDLGKGAVT